MLKDVETIRKDENLKGASALVEIAAMARVGVLSAGSKVTGQRASQMERDAKRLERRGKTARATELKTAAASLKSVKLSMSVQSEKEQIRPLIPDDNTALMQGRASKDGVGKAGLLVSLVGEDGTVLDHTQSTAGGAFVLKQAGVASDARIVVADVDGTDLGTLKAPVLKIRGSVFVDMPVERLDLTPVRPRDGPVDPETVVVPKLVGAVFEKAATTIGDDLTLGEVKLKRVVDKAGTVLEQSPEADSKVEPGTAVDLLVGTGEPVRDFRTARALVRLDPKIVAAKISARSLTTAEKAAKMKTLDDLAKLLEMETDKVAEILPGNDAEKAKVWQAATKSVLARFPSD